MNHIDCLAALVDRHTARDGSVTTCLPGLALSRYSSTQTPTKPIDRAVLYFVAQGTKVVLGMKQEWSYDRNQYLIMSMDLPIVAQIRKATRLAPILELDLGLSLLDIGAMLEEAGEIQRDVTGTPAGVRLSRTEDAILDALIRLVKRLDTPEERSFMYALIRKEIIYRILLANRAAFSQTLGKNKLAVQVGRGTQYLRKNLDRAVRSRELARVMSMSLTSMHHAFKVTTGISPIQFQKRLCLHEARRLLHYKGEQAQTASIRVGVP